MTESDYASTPISNKRRPPTITMNEHGHMTPKISLLESTKIRSTGGDSSANSSKQKNRGNDYSSKTVQEMPNYDELVYNRVDGAEKRVSQYQ